MKPINQILRECKEYFEFIGLVGNNMDTIPLMDVSRQYMSITDELDPVVLDILHGGQYILGKTVEDFEKNFAKYCGTNYAVGVGNGSDSLVIALKACGIKPGDEVITTDMSYIATAEAIIAVGGVPVFADCTSDTYTIDPNEIEKRISVRTKAIIPVHIYGQCCDMESIMDIAGKHGLFVIEDACHGPLSEISGGKLGTIGDAGCFSFFFK